MIKYECLSRNKDYSNKIDEELKKSIKNTFKFSNNGFNICFCLLSRKGVSPYECMNEWEDFSETSLHEKYEFCSNLNVEDITDTDYMHVERVSKDFEIKKIRWMSWYVS